MSAIADTLPLPIRRPAPRPAAAATILTLARRRAKLTSGNPRAVLVPLLGPALLALILGPALQASTGGLHSGLDYTAFVGIGAVGLVIPLSCVFAGLSVIIDRDQGAQRELLAAPIRRSSLVFGNLLVALVLSALQAITVVGLSAARGGEFHVTATGVVWFIAGTTLFTVFMYGLAETVASRVPNAEEYVGAIPVLAILPFFFSGALFPISAMPGALTAIAKVLPLTHALAVLRYGFIDPNGHGLHDIWGAGNPAHQAWMSLAVVAVYAIALTFVAVRMFSRSAVK
jgi:ABC-2 type transport system permease protein